MRAEDPFLEALQDQAGGDETAVVDAESVGDKFGLSREDVRRRVQELAREGFVQDTTGTGEPITVRILREGEPGET